MQVRKEIIRAVYEDENDPCDRYDMIIALNHHNKRWGVCYEAARDLDTGSYVSSYYNETKKLMNIYETIINKYSKLYPDYQVDHSIAEDLDVV